MAETYAVSMVTLRKALTVVTDRGLISRRQGSGNYVAEGRRDLGTYALFRLEVHPGGGGLPTAEVLSFDRLRKPESLPHIGTALGWGWRIRRVRSLNDTPVAVEEIWLDGRYGDLAEADLSESLYRTYTERLQLSITQAEDRVSVAPLPGWAPDARLGVQAGTPMGLVERRSFNQYGEPAEASQTWFNPERARYFARVP